MTSMLGFSGEAWLLLFVSMAIAGAAVLIVCFVVWVWERIIRRRPATPPAAALPRRRRPIDRETRELHDAQRDAVMAEMARGGPSGWYIGARLFNYEAELSDLLELALELDENIPANGSEAGHADA